MKSKQVIKEYMREVLGESSIGSSGLVNTQKKQMLTQYTPNGDMSFPTSKTKGVLETGLYKIKSSMSGVYFERYHLNTDELLRFKDFRYEEVLGEVAKFWDKKESFATLGFSHKRGILLHGKEGCGKSCITKLAMEDALKRDYVVFIAESSDPHLLTSGLRQFREVEPDRRALVVVEDVDEVIRYSEKSFLSLLDGDAQIGGVLYLGTTNYIEKFPKRLIRAGRFDRIMEIKQPPIEGRRAYFQMKLGLVEDKDMVETFVSKTDNFSFAELRDLLVSVYCLDMGMDKAIGQIKRAK